MRALRVEGARDNANRAVLAGRVDPLQDDQDGVLALRVEPLLEIGELREGGVQVGGAVVLVAAVRVAAVEARQVDLLAGLDLQKVPEALVGGLLAGHAALPRGRLRLGLHRNRRP